MLTQVGSEPTERNDAVRKLTEPRERRSLRASKQFDYIARRPTVVKRQSYLNKEATKLGRLGWLT